MKLAYLVNQYPKVSHTFIRREIAAIEDLGLEVDRFSLRGTRESLEDDADEVERLRTRVVLDAGLGGLARAGLWMGMTRPRRLLRGAKLAYSVGRRSDRGILRHVVYLAEACALARWLERAGCRHLHAHFGTNSTTVAMLCREIGGPPFSFTVHGPEEFDKPDFIGLAEKIERCAFAAAVSNHGLGQLYRRSHLRHWSKLHLVRCGVDAGFFDAPETPVPEEPRLVCVGRLCAEKGQLLLIEAAALLAQDGIAFELTLVGDGELRGQIDEAILRHGLGEKIRVMGWATGDGVRKEITRARALVLPSFAEGLPVVLMEAFALGRPVISTYVAGIPELVVPGKSGWLVPSGSVTALASAMREVLVKPASELGLMAAEGKRRVHELHDVRASAALLSSRLQEASA
ncbi:MAG TPA: glycosyltransferase [Polyangiaceae bacterium]|nr:glycosyltransferase [Polyangiaceae bacterium]